MSASLELWPSSPRRVGPPTRWDRFWRNVRTQFRIAGWWSLLISCWTAAVDSVVSIAEVLQLLDLQRQSGALVIPQVSCRPLNFEFTFAEPFIFDVMKFMNELAIEEARAPGTRRRVHVLCLERFVFQCSHNGMGARLRGRETVQCQTAA